MENKREEERKEKNELIEFLYLGVCVCIYVCVYVCVFVCFSHNVLIFVIYLSMNSLIVNIYLKKSQIQDTYLEYRKIRQDSIIYIYNLLKRKKKKRVGEWAHRFFIFSFFFRKPFVIFVINFLVNSVK